MYSINVIFRTRNEIKWIKWIKISLEEFYESRVEVLCNAVNNVEIISYKVYYLKTILIPDSFKKIIKFDKYNDFKQYCETKYRSQYMKSK